MREIFLFFTIISSNFIFSQKSVKIIYEQKFIRSDSFFNQIPEKDRESLKEIMNKAEVHVLMCNENASLYKNADLKEVVIPGKGLVAPNTIDQGLVFKPYKNWLFKDYSNNAVIELKKVDENEYYIKRPFRKEEFIFDEKKKIIEGFNCKSAFLVKPNNDTIQYWYTQDIPVLDGPVDDINLPGLILSIESKKKMIYAIRIEFSDTEYPLDKLKKSIPFITEVEYEQYKSDALKPKSYQDASGNKHETKSVIIK
ncbi:GLPGLI family protein [Flavobacterium fryxellicola]|nr:GLPGLI family protein [Flavobacterium fryxellicola]SHN77800.1 GLPGLI family protein [Flavobacterium fryxellicola]